MKNHIFKYTILHYIHTPYLGEGLNIGILFYYPEFDKFEFKYPEKLHRIKGAYQNFDEGHIKKYLREFSKIAKSLTLGLFEDNLKNIANSYFLPKDDSALQFTNYEVATYDSNNIVDIVKNYYNIYFEPYLSDIQMDSAKVVKNI